MSEAMKSPADEVLELVAVLVDDFKLDAFEVSRPGGATKVTEPTAVVG